VLLCAVGRSARLTGFGLEELGIPVGKTVQTNEYLETIYPNILAAGDVAGPFQFTHTASHQAWYAGVNALFGTFKKFKADYSVIPWATFIDPEVARVGLNEQEATEKKVAYEVTRYGIDDLDRAIADSAAEGWVKVLTVPGKDKILGVTIVGVHAGDLLAEYVLAMKHGLGLKKILGTIHTYPTLSEANKYAAGEWRRAHQPTKTLEWIGKFHAWRRA
jgi:pyruvate/2-oxoglutarate dehydrogenase complex dihydrolipoamide dehydrogenase (E3) component